MMQYTVPANVEAVAIRSDVPWEPKNFRRITTRQDWWFHDSEIIFHPNRIEVLHDAPGVRPFGVAYAAAGYFGFRRNGHCLIVPFDAVKTANGNVQLNEQMEGDLEALCPAF